MLVRSAGVILFRPGKKREYLLLHYAAGHWDFPKGMLNKGEGSMAAALRELKEETSISKAKIMPGFKETIRFFYTWEGEKVLNLLRQGKKG